MGGYFKDLFSGILGGIMNFGKNSLSCLFCGGFWEKVEGPSVRGGLTFCFGSYMVKKCKMSEKM